VLKQLTIEELLELDVTLPLRREERVMDAPAAIVVLTSEDLRRQGAASLPEALLHVPGLYVGRFTASSWIIASRGFASTVSNKLLVMIDGRSVYSPLFSGVFWNQQDALLLDLERVEVIRGPGASLWGSNAVNGVINVVSKRAADTQGLLLTVGGGAEEQFYSGARYGGRAATGHYRVYGKYFGRDSGRLQGGADARDGQRLGQGGFRIDLGATANTLTLQGDAFRTASDTSTASDIEASGINVLARWTRRQSSTSELQLQAYFDRTDRFVPNQPEEVRNTVDIDVQQRLALGPRNTMAVGASYRRSGDTTGPSPVLTFDPASRDTNLFTAFVQDEYAVSPSVLLVAGTKIERNDYTGVEWQPSVRGRWMPNGRNTVWGAVSRAVRMPTRFDTDLRIHQGPILAVVGNPDFRSESVVAYEAGYRVRPHAMLAFDFTVFRNQYDDLRSSEFNGTRIVVGNMVNDTTVGGSITATVQPRPWVRVSAAHARLSHDQSLDPGSSDIYQGRFETVDPRHLSDFTLRLDLPRGLEFDLMARHIAELPQIVRFVPGTPSYGELSLRVGWRLAERFEASIIGRDLLHADHVEFISPTSDRISRIERAIFTRFSVAF
jgi:iron complex outermembrane receptor protein